MSTVDHQDEQKEIWCVDVFFVTETKFGQHDDDDHPVHQNCYGLNGAIILNSRRNGWRTL